MKRYHLTGTMRPQIAANCIAAIKALDPGKSWTVEVKPMARRRSLDQNARFHAMCQELGDTCGYTCEELKRAVKKELGRYAMIDTPAGKMARWESSADWSKQQMAEAIELLIRWGADVGHRWRVE